MGELVQCFDNGYPWKKPNCSSGQGGRERDEDKERKAKECAFRHILRPKSSNLIAKTDLKEIYFPLSILKFLHHYTFSALHAELSHSSLKK